MYNIYEYSQEEASASVCTRIIRHLGEQAIWRPVHPASPMGGNINHTYPTDV